MMLRIDEKAEAAEAEVLEFPTKRARRTHYPHKRDTVRPFRLWDAKAKKLLPWRNYAYSWTAIEGAWAESQWLRAHEAIEVFNITNGQHIATFAVKPGRIVHREVAKGFNIRFDRRTRQPK